MHGLPQPGVAGHCDKHRDTHGLGPGLCLSIAGFCCSGDGSDRFDVFDPGLATLTLESQRDDCIENEFGKHLEVFSPGPGPLQFPKLPQPLPGANEPSEVLELVAQTVHADGTTYEGQFSGVEKHGHGKYLHVDGTTYEGEWQNNEKSGRGTERWADGAWYEGEFLSGNKHGDGMYKSGSGVQYEGQFRCDRMDGEGAYRFVGGRVYIGQWKMGHMSGHGEMTFPDGSRYEGGYEEDMKHGHGTYMWEDGRIYRGQWVHGKQDGQGSLIDTDGLETPGEWRAGELKHDDHSGAKGEEGVEQHSEISVPGAATVART